MGIERNLASSRTKLGLAAMYENDLSPVVVLLLLYLKTLKQFHTFMISIQAFSLFECFGKAVISFDFVIFYSCRDFLT